MTTLFTISKSWHESAWLYERVAFAIEGDAILLLEEGVLAIHSPTSLASFAAKCEANKINVYVLKDDLVLRGLQNQYSQLIEIDYSGFVDLVVNHDKQVAW